MKIFELLQRIKPKEGPVLGVEYEIEGRYLPRHVKNFTVHQEGSLRAIDDHPAREYVTISPVNLATTIDHLSELIKTLWNTPECEPIFSNRTSVHVHLNVSDLEVEEWFTLLFIWTVYEEAMIHYCGEARKGNLFCLSSRDAEASLFILEEFAVKQNIYLFEDNVRYAACNLAATPKYGSLEFRCMRGTLDKDVLIPWFTTIENLYLLAKAFGKPENFINKFMADPEQLTYNLFGEQHFIYNYPNWREDSLEKARRLSLILDLCDWDKFNFRDEPLYDI